jgi:hypothetical protein
LLLIKCEGVERLERSYPKVVYHRARPTRMPSAMLQAQSNVSVAKTWSGLERSDQKK